MIFCRKQLCFPCWCFLFPPTKDPFSVKEVALRLLAVRIISQLKLNFWRSRHLFALNKCYSLIFKYHPKMVTREMLPNGSRTILNHSHSALADQIALVLQKPSCDISHFRVFATFLLIVFCLRFILFAIN
jgi:hypothetical protein